MQTLRVGPTSLPGSNQLPPYLEPLVRVAESGGDVIPEISSLVLKLEFDSFTYWATTRSTPIVEGRLYELSTIDPGWAVRYDERGYMEVDPRVNVAMLQALPIVWDSSTWRGRNSSLDGFLDDAECVGIGSGVCVPIHDHSFGRARFDFNLVGPVLGPARRNKIEGAFGELMVVARFIHDLFIGAIRRNEMMPRALGRPLSAKEIACLTLSTRGHSTSQIAVDLSIDARVVETHFDSIRAKLGCLTHHEAIAWALKRGVVTK